MDFLPGNNTDEWQFLGSSTNAVPYQQVTLNQHMKWTSFSLECFVGSCSKFSGNVRLNDLTVIGAIALMWNTDEPLPLSSDLSLSTDIFIFDASGKMVNDLCNFNYSWPKFLEAIGNIRKSLLWDGLYQNVCSSYLRMVVCLYFQSWECLLLKSNCLNRLLSI